MLPSRRTRSCWSPRSTSRRCAPWRTRGRPAPTLDALTVNVDDEDTRALQEEWDRRGIPVPLTVLDSPVPRDHPADPRLRRGVRRQSPRDVVTVYIPEYVVGHWWENLLHNQSALRLKGRLLFTPGCDGDQRAVAAAVVRGGSGASGSFGARHDPPQSRDVRRDGGRHPQSPADGYANLTPGLRSPSAATNEGSSPWRSVCTPRSASCAR